MAHQSKTYSLSDDVIKAIDAARAKGESPSRFLTRMLGLGSEHGNTITRTDTAIKRAQAVSPQNASQGKGATKPQAQSSKRGMRGKGDGKR